MNLFSKVNTKYAQFAESSLLAVAIFQFTFFEIRRMKEVVPVGRLMST